MIAPYYQDECMTVLLGDCREILPEIDARDAVLVTDPPYGIKLRSGWNGAYGDCAVAGDDSTWLRDFALRWAKEKPAICFGTWRIRRPANTRTILIWDKGEHVGMGNLVFPWKPNFEEIYIIGFGFVGVRTGLVLRAYAIAGTVALARGRSHPTEKPVELMCQLISKCPPGIIVDPFCGAGATLIAAKRLGLRAIGIEIEERYCQIAVERLRQEVLPFTAPTVEPQPGLFDGEGK